MQGYKVRDGLECSKRSLAQHKLSARKRGTQVGAPRCLHGSTTDYGRAVAGATGAAGATLGATADAGGAFGAAGVAPDIVAFIEEPR